MKQLVAFLICSVTAGTSLSQNSDYYWDYEGATVKSVMVKAGNSRVVLFDLPRCKAPGLCFKINSKLLFNCSTKKIYSLGLMVPNVPSNPDISDFFDRDENLDLLAPKLKASCSEKPLLKRASIYLAESQNMEGYFLVSDTIKKNGNIISAWIETKQFEKKLSDDHVGTPAAEIQDWMYSYVEKQKAYSSKFNWKLNCENSTTANLTSIAYNPDGSVASSDTFPKADFRPVIPNTVGETILNNLCAMF